MAVKLNDVLDDIRNRKSPFSIVFYTKEGKRVSLPQADKCGLPQNVKNDKNLLGVKPKIAGRHRYTVHHKLIVQYQNQPVVY